MYVKQFDIVQKLVTITDGNTDLIFITLRRLGYPNKLIFITILSSPHGVKFNAFIIIIMIFISIYICSH